MCVHPCVCACVCECECLCVCVGVNSHAHACGMWNPEKDVRGSLLLFNLYAVIKCSY